MRLLSISLCMVLIIVSPGWAQGLQTPAQSRSLDDTLRDLQGQIRELQESVRELRQEAERYRTETLQLRNQLALDAVTPTASPEETRPPAQSADQRLTRIEEDIQLLNGKVDEQYQTKVESASKYRVRLSGVVLFNMFSNRGVVDSIDNPSLAEPRTGFDSPGTFAGTLRQSILGLEVFGPEVAGARTSADVNLDFAGGFQGGAANGVSFGVVRLRTARLRFQWANTSVVAGQDTLFFAPLAPTSFASLSSPALSYSGNLWAWVPQLRIEHKVALSDTSNLSFAGGILDGVTGEPPTSEYLRSAQAGEKSGQPAYAVRVAWTHDLFGRPFTVGTGTYYNRQNWGFNRTVDGWAATTDIDMPLGKRFSVSGEFYRGRAIGGLGGGIGKSVVLSGDLSDPATQALGLDSVGGWAQLKFAPTSKLEFNGAFGQDDPFDGDLRAFTPPQSYLNSSAFTRNREAFVNVIARPRSDLVLSLEYRRIRTFEEPRGGELANHINLSAGVLF